MSKHFWYAFRQDMLYVLKFLKHYTCYDYEHPLKLLLTKERDSKSNFDWIGLKNR